jgi:hypothetical protein
MSELGDAAHHPAHPAAAAAGSTLLCSSRPPANLSSCKLRTIALLFERIINLASSSSHYLRH